MKQIVAVASSVALPLLAQSVGKGCANGLADVERLLAEARTHFMHLPLLLNEIVKRWPATLDGTTIRAAEQLARLIVHELNEHDRSLGMLRELRQQLAHVLPHCALVSALDELPWRFIVTCRVDESRRPPTREPIQRPIQVFAPRERREAGK